MADTATTAHNCAANPTASPDPVALHMQAMNSLSRCKAMLLAAEPMYFFAQQYLAEAQKAVAALASIEPNAAH